MEKGKQSIVALAKNQLVLLLSVAQYDSDQHQKGQSAI